MGGIAPVYRQAQHAFYPCIPNKNEKKQIEFEDIIPIEILHQILNQLSIKEIVTKSSLVCRRWYSVSSQLLPKMFRLNPSQIQHINNKKHAKKIIDDCGVIVAMPHIRPALKKDRELRTFVREKYATIVTSSPPREY
jgi:hypothetical protein